MRRWLPLALALCALSASPALAEKLVSTLSSQRIEVTSGFDGETLAIFGNIEPATGSAERSVEGPFHVVIVVTGPTADRMAREKTRQFGVWLNTDQVVFKDFPSFFQVLASGRLEAITDPETLAAEGITPEIQALRAAPDGRQADAFGRELVRLMTERGLYGVNETGVNFLSATAYSARLVLPGDIPNGPFLAETLVFRDGRVIARSTESFAVRKVGFQRFLGNAASQHGLLYGLTCVLLALTTGWLGGVVFKR